jgi:hypothetical protein
MSSPRTKKMLLLAAATIASPLAVACTEARRTGFAGDIAYDGGYEDPGSFGNADAARNDAGNPDAATDAAGDATDATDATDADADADANL